MCRPTARAFPARLSVRWQDRGRASGRRICRIASGSQRGGSCGCSGLAALGDDLVKRALRTAIIVEKATLSGSGAIGAGPAQGGLYPFQRNLWTFGLTSGQHVENERIRVGFAHSANDRTGLAVAVTASLEDLARSEEHTSELQSLMRSSYAVF